MLKDLSFPAAPNTKTFDQLATLLRSHYKPTRLKVAERYRFHSASQRPGQSITDFVRELKSLAGTSEFTNEQLGDSLRDRFICGLRSEQIKRKLLSANYTFQEAVDAAFTQETAQKDVRDLGSNSHGDNSSANVNRVKRDNFASRGHTSVPIQRHGRNDKQPQRTEDKKKRCFRCGLTNHTPTAANTGIQSVSSVTKRAICSPSVATQSQHCRNRGKISMSVTQTRIQKMKFRRMQEMNFSGQFSIWTGHTVLIHRTQYFQRQQ